ncbi:ragulator complex protein LAMTOR3-like [Panonychus citri]|uniref:ragulator complex protein LAMTOR3-like n=1 Tax=Panonychus citri TaxID=50023 RepID=UPI0023070C1C|nr:ragulator complex protein LAMTOR3-like [Panonychus citri]
MSLSEELRRDLNHLISTTEGLQAILITDRDGIPIIKATTDKPPELSLKPNFLLSTAIACEQASKLGSGRCKTITCLYDSFQIIHFNHQPIMITLIASDEANTGFLLSLESQFDPILSPLKKIVHVK